MVELLVINDFGQEWLRTGETAGPVVWHHAKTNRLTREFSTSSGNRVLARTPAGTFERDDCSANEELTTPDAPWLRAAQRAGKALDPNRACPTQGLGKLDVDGALSEPQLGVRLLTRDVRTSVFTVPVQVNERGELHQVSPP
jgi:hypothetical protein